MTAAPSAPATARAPSALDACFEAFTSPAGAAVFHSIVGPNEVWKADPYDVAEIHADARAVFERLLNRAGGDPAPDKGRVLMLLGESGSGKTHLMRAFRHATHSGGRGYCGYLQMTSSVSYYGRYVLAKLVDSLQQPYCDPEVTTTGLMRLSTILLDAVPGLAASEKERLRESDIAALPAAAFGLADRLLALPRFARCDRNLIRALLLLLGDDPRVTGCVLSYLRAEDLAPVDRELLGGLVPRCREEDAPRIIFELARLMTAADGSSLVLLVDQLEDVFNLDGDAVRQFQRAIDVLTTLGEEVPTSVVVIACLEDYFKTNERSLARPKLDRLTVDPLPVRLTSQRDHGEVVALVRQRLTALYDAAGLTADLTGPFPFDGAQLVPLANLRTRDVLTACLRHQERCAQAGRWLEPAWKSVKGGGAPPVDARARDDWSEAATRLEQRWNDFHAIFKEIVPDDEPFLAGLLCWAVKQVGREVATGHHFDASRNGRLAEVETHAADNGVEKLLAAVCNKSAKGGGLGRQITEVVTRAGEVPVGLVRSAPFPSSPTAAVVKQIADVVRRGGRQVEVPDAEWRTIRALQEYEKAHPNQPGYEQWLRQARPLSQLSSLQRLLGLERLAAARPSAPSPAPPLPPAGRPKDVPLREEKLPAAPATAVPRLLRVGHKLGLGGGEVGLDPEELKQHAAFLGASGSGKTTAALNLVEQLLALGVSAILVDRKGDLCRYADPAAWRGPLEDQTARERRQALEAKVEVAVYTPGHPGGRPLSLPVVPAGTADLPSAERDQLAGFAAMALAGMLNYNPRTTAGAARLAILRKALELLAAVPGLEVGVDQVHKLVEDRDPALLVAVGGFDDRQFHQLAQDLLAFRINNQRLLEGPEKLDIDSLLGREPGAAGRTRLSVISTRFLGDAGSVEFWVAQLLASLNRWISRCPSPSLQAVVLFDEADLYLPAVRQPATKAPMEGLLRRARSAGLGLLLATQSPGDLDYKCRDNIRTWVVGQVKEETALRKLKPMFNEARVEPAAKLPGQGTGQFHLLREREAVALRSLPSLITTEQLSEDRILELARQSRR